MSIIGGCGGTQYGCCPDGKTIKNKDGSNCALPALRDREYDQILSGDIKIKKVKSDSDDYTHKITFSKKNISKVLMYQVWSDTSVDLNNDRIVKEVKATSWVKSAFRKVETGTVPSIPFTPTTVMELDDGECPYHHKKHNKDECRHVFVIKRALVNKCGQVVFYVSSKDIVLPSNPNQKVKRLKTIPTGSFCRSRFDIDIVQFRGNSRPVCFFDRTCPCFLDYSCPCDWDSTCPGD
jgi:hypothetical protein